MNDSTQPGTPAASDNGRTTGDLGPFRLGEWQVDPVSGTLRHSDRVDSTDPTVRLEPKVMAVLAELAREPGAVVSKEALIDAVWANTYVGEAALSRCISELRRMLGDDARNPSYIETLPKRGYRLVAEVQRVAARQSEAVSADGAGTPLRPRINHWVAAAMVAIMFTLWWTMVPAVDPATAEVDSIAVMPLRDLSEDVRGPRFAEALTAQLTTELAGIEGLSVVSAASARSLRDADATVRDVAQQLGVDAVVDGTVQVDGDRVLISLELLHGATDFHLWAGSFREVGEELLEVEHEVAEQAMREIAATLAARSSGNRLRPPVAGAARDLLMQGRTLARRETPTDLLRALDYYRQALEIEPAYAAAEAANADALATMAWHGWSPAEEAYAEARTSAYRALDLDPALADAHAVLAAIAAEARWDWPEAERLFIDSVRHDERSVSARERYARYLLRLGRTDEALELTRRALELDGRDLRARTTHAMGLMLDGRAEEAADALMRVLELDDDIASALVALCATRNQLDDARAAVAVCRRAAGIPGYELERAALGIALARSGDSESARVLLNQLETEMGTNPDAALAIAGLRLVLGDRDRALAAVETAFAARSLRAAAIAGDPYLRPLLDDVRVQELLERAVPPPAR